MKKTTSLATPTPKFYTETTIKNLTLDGVKKFTSEQITSTYEVILGTEVDEPPVTRKLLEEVTSSLSYNLSQVTVEEIIEYRKSTLPCFVLKQNNNFYFSVISDDISFVSCGSSLGKHMCSWCQRLSAASDTEGGCAKVRELARYIERYPWITKGIETFNTKHDALVVFQCEHFKEYQKQSTKKTALELRQLKLGLAQNVWEDIGSYDEVRQKIEKNMRKKF